MTEFARNVEGSLDIFCGHPSKCPESMTFVVSLDADVVAYCPNPRATRIVRHIPNPFRGKGKPIDMSVIDMDEVAITAHMIVALSTVGDVFFHCRHGRDRTGIVKDAIEKILMLSNPYNTRSPKPWVGSPLETAATNKGTTTDEQEVKQ